MEGEILGVIGAFVRLSREKYRYVPQVVSWCSSATLIQQEMLALHDADISAISRPIACRTMYMHVTPHAFAIPKSL